jgi:hypothetical protein
MMDIDGKQRAEVDQTQEQALQKGNIHNNRTQTIFLSLSVYPFNIYIYICIYINLSLKHRV